MILLFSRVRKTEVCLSWLKFWKCEKKANGVILWFLIDWLISHSFISFIADNDMRISTRVLTQTIRSVNVIRTWPFCCSGKWHWLETMRVTTKLTHFTKKNYINLQLSAIIFSFRAQKMLKCELTIQTVHRNSVWIRKPTRCHFLYSLFLF